MGTTDSNGIFFYETTDPISPLQALLNVGQQSVSDAIGGRAKQTDSPSSTAPSSPAVGDLWYQTDTWVTLVYNGTTWRPSGRYPRGVWTLGSAVGVISGVFTLAPIATAVGTPDSTLANSAGAITVSRTGTYDLTAQTIWNGVGGNRRALIVTVNGATIDSGGNVAGGGRVVGSITTAPPGSAVDYTVTTRFPPFEVTAGEVIRLFVFHDVGSPISLNVGSATNYLGLTTLALQQVG